MIPLIDIYYILSLLFQSYDEYIKSLLAIQVHNTSID